MSTYQNMKSGTQIQNRQTNTPAGASSAVTPEEGIRINGYGQVLDMLRTADASFRESLLKRISAQNPALGKKLRAAI